MFKNIFLAMLLTMTGLAYGAAPSVGDMAPEFAAKGSDGKTYKLSEFTKEKKIVVLEWFNKDCPYVHKFYDSKTMQKLQSESTSHKDVVWLTVASSAKGKEGFLTAAEASKVRSEKGMSNTALLLDGESKLATLYGAKTTPHMFVIDKNGKIAYEGALDDHPSADPKTLTGATNYVHEALTALLTPPAGVPIKTSSTTPYGCSVKY